MNVFLFGAGYSARAYARRVTAGDIQVSGTTRARDNFSRLQDAGIEPFLFAGGDLSQEISDRLGGVTHLVVSAAPDENGDPVLRAAAETIANAMPELKWIGYLSTVGVYGNHDGDWVDEASECRPVSKRSMYRVNAEREWIKFGDRIDKPVALLRLAGIYGPGRNAFVKLKSGTARRLIKQNQVFNRIHVDDIAAAIDHLGRNYCGGIFNVTDNEPAPPQDVIAYAAELMGVEVPPDIPFDEAELTPMARSFYGENKRVSNTRLKETGFTFQYPDYRHTMSALWANGKWQSE